MVQNSAQESLKLPITKIEKLLDSVIREQENYWREGFETLSFRFSGPSEQDNGGIFLFILWESLKNLLITGTSYIYCRLQDGSMIFVNTSEIGQTGGGTLESAVYTYLGVDLTWEEMIRIDIQQVDNVGYRFFAWLPTGDVLMDDSESLAELLKTIVERCFLDVIRRLG